MAGGQRALEWLARRYDGESVALIASRDGVAKKTVLRWTREFGPFPAATQRLHGRIVPTREQVAERNLRWIELRRQGKSSTEIAAAEGFSRQLVSSVTAGHGPFPSADTVAAWVSARRALRTLAEVGLAYGVPASRVARHTAQLGPFPPPSGGARIPDGLLGISAIADHLGLSSPTLIAWRRAGRIPTCDFTTARGRELWLKGTIDRWVSEAEWLQTCPDCGARCVSASRHQGTAHA